MNVEAQVLEIIEELRRESHGLGLSIKEITNHCIDRHGGTLSARARRHLLDLKLPKIDGIEVLRAIKSDPRTNLIPVVVLTTSREEKDLVESYNLCANSYIQKPEDFEQFRDVVSKLSLYWLVVNHPPPSEFSQE